LPDYNHLPTLTETSVQTAGSRKRPPRTPRFKAILGSAGIAGRENSCEQRECAFEPTPLRFSFILSLTRGADG
jgi:hypothetical protein